jgi:hypothetical protein
LLRRQRRCFRVLTGIRLYNRGIHCYRTGFNPEKLIKLSFISLIYTEWGDQVDLTVNHDHSIYLWFLALALIWKWSTFLDSSKDLAGIATLSELEFYLTEN